LANKNDVHNGKYKLRVFNSLSIGFKDFKRVLLKGRNYDHHYNWIASYDSASSWATWRKVAGTKDKNLR